MVALPFAILTQFLMSNQVASGLALTLFGLGLAALFGKPVEGVKAGVDGALVGLGPTSLYRCGCCKRAFGKRVVDDVASA